MNIIQKGGLTITRSEKRNALAALALLVFVLIFTRHWQGYSVPSIVEFGLVLYAFALWGSRAFATPWIFKADSEELISCKPASFKIFVGIVGIAFGLLAWYAFDFWERTLSATFFGLLSILFLSFASDYTLRLDLACRKYTYSRGFGPLKRTTMGSFDGGFIIAYYTKKGQSMVQFRPYKRKYGLPLNRPLSSEQAYDYAARLSEHLHLKMDEIGRR